ncbi:hypothetical protein RHMOL_Rhmol09G0111800 [Rhododendron molle]|uniref:Uncharacterized protein n=1 Tax=Rhododendron molle TaxID=49168 RepID=A0ACC0ME07_RHOML|nr:hypothetical protein RHMOL_Rhmol09G0111800 [Rhododendron molle]
MSFALTPLTSLAGAAPVRVKMAKSSTVSSAKKLVESAMKGNDASHDAAHVFRVRDLALSLAREEGLSSSPDSMEIHAFLNGKMEQNTELTLDAVVRKDMSIMGQFLFSLSGSFSEPVICLSWQVELAALLHDIGDYKYMRDSSEGKIVEEFLEAEGVDESKKIKILSIIKGMGFKEEVEGYADSKHSAEFGVVQDADRLDAIGAIGIARCLTFGGSRNNVLHDPSILPRSDLSKGQYMEKNKQTTMNHFHEKLLKLKDLMKTKAGQRRAEKRHKFMEDFLKEFYEEWDGRS